MSFRQLALETFIKNITEAFDQTLQAAYLKNNINSTQGSELPYTVLPTIYTSPSLQIILAILPYRVTEDGESDMTDYSPKVATFLKDQIHILLDRTLLDQDVKLAEVEDEPGTVAISVKTPEKLVLTLEELISHHGLSCHDDLPRNLKPMQPYYTQEEFMRRFNALGMQKESEIAAQQTFLQPAMIYPSADNALFDAEINRQSNRKVLPFSLQRLYALAKDVIDNGPTSTPNPDFLDKTPRKRQEFAAYMGLYMTH